KIYPLWLYFLIFAYSRNSFIVFNSLGFFVASLFTVKLKPPTCSNSAFSSIFTFFSSTFSFAPQTGHSIHCAGITAKHSSHVLIAGPTDLPDFFFFLRSFKDHCRSASGKPKFL